MHNAMGMLRLPIPAQWVSNRVWGVGALSCRLTDVLDRSRLRGGIVLLAGGVEPMRGDQLVPGEKRLGRDCGAANLSSLPSVFFGLRFEWPNPPRLEWEWI